MTGGKAGFTKKYLASGGKRTNGSQSVHTLPDQPPIQQLKNTTYTPTRHVRSKPQTCPECGSSKLFKDGFRYLYDGAAIQRLLCRTCGYRFSSENGRGQWEKPLKEISDWHLKGQGNIPNDCQVCVLDKKAKNLIPQTEQKESFAETSPKTQQDVKGLFTVYMAKALQQGLSPITIDKRVECLKYLLKLGADLNDPLTVWQTIEKRKWKDGTKQLTASAYKHFCKTFKINMPSDLNFNKWQKTERIPYVPLESEIDQLTAACNPKTATFLQLLKETGMRSGEAWQLKWLDFDFERKILTLNNTEKKGKPRQFKINDKLIAMLLRMPKKTERVWNGNINHFRITFAAQKRRVAFKLQNPRIKQICFHALRHFYACKLYHNTKDILLVQERLGHRSILNTMVYTQLVEWDEDEYTVRRPKTAKEEDELVEVGFQYVRFDDREGVPIYRKRK
jgi:integrase